MKLVAIAIFLCLAGVLLVGFVLSGSSLNAEQVNRSARDELCDDLDGIVMQLQDLDTPELAVEEHSAFAKEVLARSAVLELLMADARALDPNFHCYDWDTQ